MTQRIPNCTLVLDDFARVIAVQREDGTEVLRIAPLPHGPNLYIGEDCSMTIQIGSLFFESQLAEAKMYRAIAEGLLEEERKSHEKLRQSIKKALRKDK